MQDKVLKVAIIGVGNMGKKYAEMITSGKISNMKLTAIVIRRAELIKWGEDLTNITGEKVQIFRSTEELFNEEEKNIQQKNNISLFDAVIIATPHKIHKELTIRAFKLNKDVLCDKPVAADIGEALAMTNSAKENDRIYGVVFQQRLYPKYKKIKEIIDNGEIGELKRVSLINSRYLRTAYYHSSGSWRSSFIGEGGGALINQGQHILDIFQYMFGMPQSLFSVIGFGKYNDFSVDDEATIVMNYKSGLTATFVLSTGEAFCEERIEIIGTKARVLLEDNTLSIIRHRDINEYIKTENINARGDMNFSEEKFIYEKIAEPYVELLEGFAKAVLNHNEKYLVANGNEGINALMLCAGSYYSACKGVKVDLPLAEEDYRELMEELIKKENTEI